MVFIEPGRKYATVVLDMVSIATYYLPTAAQNEISKIFLEHRAWDVSLSDQYCSARKISLLDAERVAEVLFDIAMRSRQLRMAS